MAREDVELVRDHFKATNERDFERVMGAYAEDVELYVHPDAFLEAGTLTGREAVGKWFGDFLVSFESDFHFVIDEARDLGHVVFLRASYRGRGRASGAEVQGESGYLYDVRDRKIVRVELYPTGTEALEAAAARE